MKELIKNSISRGISYLEYIDLVGQYATNHKTTGTKQIIERIEFTKLNTSRMRRLDKTVKLTAETINIFKETPKQTWLVLVESWCGDAAQTLPILHKIVEASANIDMKIVLRDDNLKLMNAFLTEGGQAIPKVIIIDENLKVLDTWGPRSKKATQLVLEYKKQFGTIDAEFKKNLQKWYNKDKGISIIDDFLEITTSFKTLTEV